MGGCCSLSQKVDKDITPVYYYNASVDTDVGTLDNNVDVSAVEIRVKEEATFECPRTLEDRELVPFTNVTSSAVSPEPFIDKNMDSSVPDACQAPPAPVPCDVGLTCSDTLPEKSENCNTRFDNMQPFGSSSVGSTVIEDGKLNGSECISKVVGEQDSLNVVEDEPSKLIVPDVMAAEEEDVCPTCLEEYDIENPRIITKCEHHYHLACILEWMERSNTCPICDQIMIFEMGGE